MCNEYYLLELILQPPQQIDDVVPVCLVERAEHLVQDQQGERLARALGDHL